MQKEYTEMEQKQLERLTIAGINMNDVVAKDYIAKPDDLGIYRDDMDIPDGYKKCGHCNHVLKYYMFNINNSAKNKCTGNCKACQKKAAAKSYEKTKGNRNYKEYYEQNKERKREHGRKYYQKNREAILEKQKEYHTSKAGKKVMKKSHAKRRKLLAANKGVNYKREYVIDRDKLGGEFPICYLCGEPIRVEREIQLDHVVPVVLGGKDCFTNVACTHELCNLRKEKDARNLSVTQVETIIQRAEQYIDEHPELFEN